jgi:endoglucanase
VAREEQKKDRDFSYQRRVMDGGTCEATPFQLKGYMAGGMAIPLRNYHNQSGKVIAPEGVHLRDVEGSVRLLVQTLRRIDEFEVPVDEIRQRWDGAWQKYHGRLQGSDKEC